MTAVSHLFSDSRVATFFFNRTFSLVHCITLWTVANPSYTAVGVMQCTSENVRLLPPTAVLAATMAFNFSSCTIRDLNTTGMQHRRPSERWIANLSNMIS